MNKGTIFLIGVFDKEGSTNIHIMNEFKKLYKKVVPYNYRTVASGMSRAASRAHLTSSILQHKPDVIFVCKGDKWVADELLLMKASDRLNGTKVVYWYMDSLATARHFIPFVKLCDFVFCTYTDVEAYFRVFNKNVYRVFDGTDVKTFYPHKLIKQYDVYFPGTYTQGRGYIIQRLRDEGFKVLVTGNGWAIHNDNFPPVFGEGFAKCVSKSLYCLNLLTHPWQSGLSNRIFNLLASGGRVITEYCKDFDLLNDALNVAYFRSFKDLLAALLGSKPERELFRNNEVIKSIDTIKEKYTWEWVLEYINTIILSEQSSQLFKPIDTLVIPFWHGLGDAVMALPVLQKLLKGNPNILRVQFLVRNNSQPVEHYRTLFNNLSDGNNRLQLCIECYDSYENPWEHPSGYHVGLREVFHKTMDHINRLNASTGLLPFFMPHRADYTPHKTDRMAIEAGVKLSSDAEYQPIIQVKGLASTLEKYSSCTGNRFYGIHISTAVKRKNPSISGLTEYIQEIKQSDIFWFGDPVEDLFELLRDNDNFIHVIGYTNMQETINVLALCNEVIASDSVVFQIACALGKKVTGLFTIYPGSQVRPLWYVDGVTIIDGVKNVSD